MGNGNFPATPSGDARAHFPRGLIQPAGAFRFSADALLLAAFAHVMPDTRHVLDLGCGCGVTAFALQLRAPQLQATGIDVQREMTAAADANARLLGLAERFASVCADIRLQESRCSVAGAGFDLVAANPPYRPAGSGRLPHSQARRIALFDPPGLLQAFVDYATFALRPGGSFVLIFPAKRLQEACDSLWAARLTLCRIRGVCCRKGNLPDLNLLEARKLTSRPPRDMLSRATAQEPLFLHEGSGKNTVFSRTAAEFCPYLTRGRG